MNSLEKSLRAIAEEFSPATLAHSLQAEDMVLTDVIARAGLPIELFVLDTDRLHADSLYLIEKIRHHYSIDVRVYAPDPGAVSEYVRRHGRDAFYGSVDLRKRCCEIRKVEPLARALAGAGAWITGLRAGQSAQRRGVDLVEADRARGLLKLNPLCDWTRETVADFARRHEVPTNPLHEKGFLSIGCAPCTRAVRPGEPERAGRWWWEDDAQKECGLHLGGAAR
jgi:phosphoadenosine phosphosulfate reductase